MKVFKINKDGNLIWVTVNKTGRIEYYSNEKYISDKSIPGTYITNIGNMNVTDIYLDNNRLCIVLCNQYDCEFIERYNI